MKIATLTKLSVTVLTKLSVCDGYLSQAFVAIVQVHLASFLGSTKKSLVHAVCACTKLISWHGHAVTRILFLELDLQKSLMGHSEIYN